MTFSLGITFVFLLYCIFWIEIPGMLFSTMLLQRRFKFSTRLLAGFFIGFTYMAALYLIESLTGINGIIMSAGPVTSAIGIFCYFKNDRPSIYNASEHFRWTYVIIFGFIYLVSMLNFQFKYLFALSGASTQVYHDVLFHTGNIVSLSHSFPNTDIRIEGLTFYYHYFYELIFAMSKHIFRIDAFRLYLNGNAIICAFPLTMAMVTLGERIRGVKEVTPLRYFFYCSGLLASGIAMLPLVVVGGRLPVSWLGNHIFSNINAMGLALSLTMLVIDVLAEIWYDKLVFKNLILLFILSVAATGFKGTTATMLVGITWAVFVIEWIITKNFHLQKLLYNVALTLGFILTYITVTVGLNPSGANNRAMVVTAEGTLEAGRVGQLFTKLGLDYMAFPWVVIAVILSIICILGPCVITFVAFTVEKFTTLIKEGVIGDIFDWFAIGMVLMGVIGFSAVSVPGLSQGYFVLTSAGLLFYCSVRYMIGHRMDFFYKVMHFWFAVGTVLLAVDVVYFCYADVKQNAVYKQEAGDRADMVSAETMEAYLWIRDNTPEDSVIAVDRLSEKQENDYRSIYFYASAFAERQCYLEGYDYSDVAADQVEAKLSMNEKFYSEDFYEADAALEVAGVDYLVVTKQEHPDYKAASSNLKLVFNNSEVMIYKYD
ncbi:hypothetical protein [Pseudobutyrivibrio xylanivorans]|uniref:Chlor_Arch_YYY domain-containing protein n=1 Tax=Pseudobutyrivibrio xylanivorans DSM 14809 TaxID=1123012 RepID=A0A1M6I0E1_PSEXY|nr:hypothetical protein [Pseudobutyrivibrio xylanivorans]SHJ27885.1 hypothetical protein SAMN02745725_02161 [Pseudobutyrivibrio xylanivorans DSM 14809]